VDKTTNLSLNNGTISNLCSGTRRALLSLSSALGHAIFFDLMQGMQPPGKSSIKEDKRFYFSLPYKNLHRK
jgi:hypothetical protein